MAVDTDSQLITAVEVLPGNAWDSTGALELVERSESGTGVPVAATMGDTAYGDGQTRQEFADAGRELVARMPGRPDRACFAKEDFHIDLEADACTCPAGHVAAGSQAWGTRTDHAGRKYRVRGFRFAAAVCGACPLRDGCVSGKTGAGRTVLLHPQERLFQKARNLQRSPAFAEYRGLRVVVEHRLARLVQLGIRQARYIGRAKTKFQLSMAATVANLTLMAGKVRETGDKEGGQAAALAADHAPVSYGILPTGLLMLFLPQILLSITPKVLPSGRGFRPGF